MIKQKKLLVIGVDQAIPYFIKKFANENLIPNINHLIENGVFSEAYPCPPCDTPTNWTTIATGASTAIHGSTSFYMHLSGEPLDFGLKHRSRTQLSRYCKAEYFWDVADKCGLSTFVINYPGGWPRVFKKGAMSLLSWPIPESLPRIISSQVTQKFSKTNSNFSLSISKAEEFGDQVRSYSIPLQISIDIKYGIIKEKYSLKAFIIDSKGEGYDKLWIQNGCDKENHMLDENSWSNWILVSVETIHGKLPCLLKIRFFELNKDGSSIKIQRTNIYNIKGWTTPEGFAEKLVKNVIIPEPPKDQKVEYMISGKVEPYLLYARQEALTLVQAINFAKKSLDWQICFFHIHHLDTVNHKTLAYLYEKSPLYSEKAARQALDYIKTAYKIVDELVGLLLKSCVDQDTIVVFISDHGAIPTWKIVNIPLALMRAGLLKYQWNDAKKKYCVDWKKTLAFPYLEPPYIWVNLKGREPHGIVNPSDYETVRDDIIKALYDIKDSKTGEKVVKLAVKKEDASELGQNGERIGDVIFFLNPPFQIFDDNLSLLNAAELSRKLMKKPETYNAQKCFGAHAYYLPSTKFGNFSISSPLIICGSGIKKGVTLKQPVKLIDVAPTLSRILSIPKPKQSQGRVLTEIFE